MSGGTIKLDSILFLKQKQSVCGWMKVRHLPESWPNWYPSSDQVAGTDNFGDPMDDLIAWSIEFSTLTYDQLMFTTNNLQHWIIASKTLFTPGVWFSNAMVDNIRSSISPLATGKS